MAKTNWDRYFQSQMQDAELRTLVEAERAALEIGHRLATLRRKRKLSQTQVAAALKMSPATISRLEHNARNVTVETLLKVARVLGAALDIRVKTAQWDPSAGSARLTNTNALIAVSLRGAERRSNPAIVQVRTARLPRSRWSLAMTALPHVIPLSRLQVN